MRPERRCPQRLSGSCWPESILPLATPDLTYTYDSFGRLDQVHRDGNLHADYDYDATSLLLAQEKLNQDTRPKTLKRHYDSQRRPLSVEFTSSTRNGRAHLRLRLRQRRPARKSLAQPDPRRAKTATGRRRLQIPLPHQQLQPHRQAHRPRPHRSKYLGDHPQHPRHQRKPQSR